MKERPILFSGAMVRALLAGTKTQTRRVARLRDSLLGAPLEPNEFAHGIPIRSCPYGTTGDRLWVRESHWWFKDEHDPVTGYFPPALTSADVEYRADGEKPGRIWRPSIHMPRWASRITLELTSVRVERLQSISHEDAWDEGIRPGADGLYSCPNASFAETPVDAYRQLWEHLNGAKSWAENPWVWVLCFRRL